MKLSIGIARRVITPALGTLLFGYPTTRHGNVVADDLNATALVLRSGETTAAIVSLDLAIIDEPEIEAMRAMVSAQTGIASRNITIHSSHTHSGPVTVRTWGWGEKNQEYLDSIRPRIAEAVAEALGNLEPVQFGIGEGTTETGINRREIDENGNVILGFHEWGPRDDKLTVVRFAGESGTVATLVHLGAHPTSRGHQPDISRDWPGVMADRLETATGAPVIFINGAFGDVAPRTSIAGVIGDGEPASREVGYRAANDAIAIWRDIKEYRDEAVQVYSADFEMPYRKLESLDEANRQLEILGDCRDAFGNDGANWNFWNAVREAHQSAPKAARVFAQTITAIGPLAIVPMAGEIFAEISLRLRKASPFAHTLVAGTTNGAHGYYVTREARGRGGYEVWVARAFSAYLLADDIDDVLVRENLALLRALAAQQ